MILSSWHIMNAVQLSSGIITIITAIAIVSAITTLCFFWSGGVLELFLEALRGYI